MTALPNLEFPNLETERLWLRQATLEDAEAVFAVFADSQVTQFHDLDTFTQLDQALAVIQRRASGFASGRGIRWAIAQKSDDGLIGSCGFSFDPTQRAAEVGYELASRFWRQGIMSEALRAILDYGFADQKLEFVTAQIMLDNLASRRLLEKLGFQSQGVLKRHGFWKGQHHDLEQFKLTRSEFTAL